MGVSILLWVELEGCVEMHPQAKLALVRRILQLVSNTLSEEEYATAREKLYEQLLRSRIWNPWFSKRLLHTEIDKFLDQLQGVTDPESASDRLDQFVAYLDSIPREAFSPEIQEHDYSALESFPLKWRWTDARWNLLPPDVLANIRPISKNKALEVDEHSRLFHPDEGFVQGTFDLVAELQILQVHNDAEYVRDWLRQHIPASEERLIISWDCDNAVVTTVAIFCEYWDDFCYPGSDDVLVSPLHDEWMLFYWHEEVFFFGRRCES